MQPACTHTHINWRLLSENVTWTCTGVVIGNWLQPVFGAWISNYISSDTVGCNNLFMPQMSIPVPSRSFTVIFGNALRDPAQRNLERETSRHPHDTAPCGLFLSPSRYTRSYLEPCIFFSAASDLWQHSSWTGTVWSAGHEIVPTRNTNL